MANEFIGIQGLKGLTGPSLSESECLRIFDINVNSYKGWVRQQESRKLNGTQSCSEAEAAWKADQERILEIVKSMNYVPGVRTMHLQYLRRYGKISLKRIRKLMRSLSLFATKRKRDAYKHQATHNHPFTAPAGNVVNREFYLGPRRVVCGDITYLYYGPQRKLVYWCVFKDAFTAEVLGQALSTKMDEALIKKAYDQMMGKHGDELKRAICALHTDQGSQFCSNEFQEMIVKDGFLPSMSRRGNSLDNAPIESFFGLCKTELLDKLAMCITKEQVETMLNNYVEKYNNEYPQLELGGLCPSEFYDYAITGVYPMEKYFGVDAKDLLSLKELRRVKERFADEEAKKRREAYANEKYKAFKAAPMGMVNPTERIEKDRKLVENRLKKVKKKLEKVQDDMAKLEVARMMIDVAEAFVKHASAADLKELVHPENWKNYPELSYIYAMDEMF